MSRQNSPLPDLETPARAAASHPWMEKLARWGYAAKGVVYFIIGLLATQAAFTTGGKTTDSQGALVEILNQPFGKILLAAIAIGLSGYVLWCLVQAIFDPEHSRKKKEAIAPLRRIGYALSALGYAGLALTAVKLLIGRGSTGGDATKDWTARFMSQPFGQWLVGLAGLAVIGVAISYFYQAYKASFQKHLQLHRLSRTQQKWVKSLGRFGIAARGVVFGIIGTFLCLAALNSNPDEARGIGGSLAVLANQPSGPWILGIVATGLIAYSLYCLLEARYRSIAKPN
ncbi:MAG: hypothetical protein N5P05_001138 [Chroococcopsis gigantea SAG 12.99]|jgi:membrane protein YqaA with SNARE-associated domain|nr:DUF1206 domain-containing protein [Chlorogloea purpurea SAG 13.99]MDV2999532.1 hypothetical protein [Chroococcopsis gigantea SAG 12.99]